MSSHAATERTPVLVVGGGIVGLSAAMFLAFHNVPTVLIERHAAISVHPRAIGYTVRILEHFRKVGLGDAFPQVPSSFRLRRVQAESLAGQWTEGPQWNPNKPTGPPIEYSPTSGSGIAQDKVEAVIRKRAEELGADIRFNVRMLDFTQDECGVHATVRDADGKEYEIAADYMVAADGHRSSIREALGIQTHGRGHIQILRSILFRADLDRFLDKGVQQWALENSDFKGFLTTYADGRWVVMMYDDKERDVQKQREVILQATGIPDLEFDIVTTGRWELSARIAEKYSAGRVFLAGDAAHTLPPTRGGYGANTGIHDAASLAWKLASVISGVSKAELLETYNEERQPIGWNRHQQVFARPDYSAFADPTVAKEAIIDDDAIELGELYRSGAVLADNLESLPAAQRPDQWAGQPGTRAPHVWMMNKKSGARVSTIDLFGKNWTVITQDEVWRAVVQRAGETLGLVVDCVSVGTDIEDTETGAFVGHFGLGETGASLVRPDGVVAWRVLDFPADAEETFTSALRKVLYAMH